MRIGLVAAGLVLVSSALVALAASAQEVRTAAPMARAPGRCARPACRTLWRAALGGGWRAAVVESSDDPRGRDRSLSLVVSRAGARWSHPIAETGSFCGGDSEFVRVASLRGVTLRDFAEGPLPELFVDYHESVSGDRGGASVTSTIVCTVEGSAPSCLGAFVAGDAATPLRFPARGRVAAGTFDFTVAFP